MITVMSGTATALSPIVHGGEQRGTTMTEFRRVKAVVEGKVELLPVISGNSVRGILRRRCAEFSLQAAGIDSVKHLATYQLLFGGGKLGGKKGSHKAAGQIPDKYINVAEERTLRELLPALSVFGGSLFNRILGGKLDPSEWMPICREAKGMLPEEYHEQAEQFSMYDLLDIIPFTRRDSAKERRLQQYLDADTLAIYEQQKEATQDDDEKEQAQQGRYAYEALIPGTVFAVEFVLHDLDEVEMGTFLGGLALFATYPRIGGRAGWGWGKVKLNLKQTRIDEPVRLVSEIAPDAINVAQKHLAERKEATVELLEEIARRSSE